MPPADCFLDVVDAASLLQKTPQGLAVKGITRFEFTDGEFGLGHKFSQRTFQPMKPPGRLGTFSPLTEISDTVDFDPGAHRQPCNLHTGPCRTDSVTEHLGVKRIHLLEVLQVGQEDSCAHNT